MEIQKTVKFIDNFLGINLEKSAERTQVLNMKSEAAAEKKESNGVCWEAEVRGSQISAQPVQLNETLPENLKINKQI